VETGAERPGGSHRRRRTLGALAISIAVAAAPAGVVAACKGEPAVPAAPLPDAGLPPPVPAAPDAGPPPDAAPAVQTGPCDQAMQLALRAAIQQREKGDLAPGLKPEGGFACEHVAEGGKVSLAVTLQQGRCYTFIGDSYPNVTELDIHLKPNVFGPSPPPGLPQIGALLAQDGDIGPKATLGRGKDCYKWALPLPMAALVEATARVGAGPIAVQVYSK
jgi:hypothetical protein